MLSELPSTRAEEEAKSVPIWRKHMTLEGFTFTMHRLADNYCFLVYEVQPLSGRVDALVFP